MGMEITSIENCGRHRGVSQLALTASVTFNCKAFAMAYVLARQDTRPKLSEAFRTPC